MWTASRLAPNNLSLNFHFKIIILKTKFEKLQDIISVLKTTKYAKYLDQVASEIDAKIALGNGDNRNSTSEQRNVKELVKRSLLSCFNSQFFEIILQTNSAKGVFKQLVDFMRYPFMINNARLVINAVAASSGEAKELMLSNLSQKFNPVGNFAELETLKLAQNLEELYDVYLSNTDIAKFFVDCKYINDIDFNKAQLIQNLAQKKYLEFFYKFALDNQKILQPHLLKIIKFEIDMLNLQISLNSLSTDTYLKPEEKFKIFPKEFGCSSIHPSVLKIISECDNKSDLIDIFSRYQVILGFFF